MNLFQTRSQAKKMPRSEQDPRLVSLLKPSGSAAEAYRDLRTNLLYSSERNAPPGMIVISSPDAGEMRSLACANLAVALAQAGRYTALVDCDLRNPVQLHIFGAGSDRSAKELFTDDLSMLDDCPEPLPGLKLIAAEGSTPDPTAVLESESFAEFLKVVRSEFDHVLIDAPCLQESSDAISLAARSDGVLLVLEANKSRKASVRQCVNRLRAAEANVIGTVAVNV